MRILLLGEYSSLHNNLKEGLRELGHDVTLAGYRDGFKRIPVDLDFDSSAPCGIAGLIRRIKPFANIHKLYGYDVVQIMNPFVFYRYFPSHFFHKKIFDNNNRCFLLAAGDDALYWKKGRSRLRYGPFEDFLKYDHKREKFFMESERAYRHNEYVIDRVRRVIPIMYEYQVSYEGHPKLADVIPIPINVRKIDYRENRINGKLVVFHGLNRYGYKGTRHVEEAFSYLRKKYPKDLELIISGGMPVDRYLEVMRKTNVVIDQTNSYSCGVNAIYALAMGKVVLGGAEPESLHALKVDTSPVINITPSAESIVQEVERLLDLRSSIPEMGFFSREFAERNHCYLKISEKYINEWQRND